MLFYRVIGKAVVFTAHNVNAAKRDGKDSLANRISLKIQYSLCNHIFVHTGKMKQELISEFVISESKVTVIPFGVNNTLPNTAMTSVQAKEMLGLQKCDKALLFFGRIAPYKGLGYLVEALGELIKVDKTYRLIIAGNLKNCNDYWREIQSIRSIGQAPEATLSKKFSSLLTRSRTLPEAANVLISCTIIYFKVAFCP